MNFTSAKDFATADFDTCFEVYYQMQFDMSTNLPISAEALLRLSDESGENTAPQQVLDRAERFGAIGHITNWVINQSLKDFRELAIKHNISHIAVNVSPSELLQPYLVENVKAALVEHNLPGCCLKVEITERLPLLSIDKINETLEALNRLGVKAVLDDFGTGYTSLPSLVQMPISGLKLDRTFCTNLEDPKYHAIAESLIELARKLDLSIVIEGIENHELRRDFVDLGCFIGQGYYFQKPQAFSTLVNTDFLVQKDHRSKLDQRVVSIR